MLPLIGFEEIRNFTVLYIIFVMKNINKQSIKRPWKTPSPSLHENIKSPRFSRAYQNKNNLQVKQLKESENHNEFGKHKNIIKNFRSELMNFKEQANKIIISEEKKKVSQLTQRNHRHLLKTENTPNDPSMTPYSSYFNGSGKVDMLLKSNEEQEDKNFFTGSYRQSLRKCAAQNAKLKKELRQVLARQKNLLSQKDQWREQFKQLKNSTKKNHQNSQNQEMQKLRNLLEETKNEASQSNLSVFKLQHELFQAQNQISRLVKRNQKLELEKKNLSKKKCSQCQKMVKNIEQLSKELELKMLQLGNKDTLINGLCTEIKNLEAEMKSYQKPKQIQKKLTWTINQINEELIKCRIKMMNRHYKGKSTA